MSTLACMYATAHCMFSGFARTALDWGLAAGLSVSGLYGPLKAWRERKLADIFASGQTLRLQFPKEDLGFVYNQPGAAICPEAAAAADPSNKPVGSSSKPGGKSHGLDLPPGDSDDPGGAELGRNPRAYHPSCKPGSRLPHCVLHRVATGMYLGAVITLKLSLLS